MSEATLKSRRLPANPDDVRRFCDAMTGWANVLTVSPTPFPGFKEAWQTMIASLYKSCLADRMVYGGEQPSQTPCPVHKGRWSGCHFMWPGRVWSNGQDVEVPKMQQEWYDAGCRCAYHQCGCTTGWNPDEHCGCGGEEMVLEVMRERKEAALARLTTELNARRQDV